jgi:hypothetical protein
MGQQGDYDGQYGQGQPVWPQQQDPRRRPAVTPPQWQQQAPPQRDGTGQPRYPYRQDQQPTFTPGYQGQLHPPRGQYPPPQQYEQPRYAPQPAPRPQWQQPRKKRRVFLWVFLGVQALFLIWIIAGLASHPAGPSAAQQAAQQCANGGWEGLFKSQADCDQHYAVALNDAGNVGKGIGAAFIVIFWMVVDFFLGLGYGIYRLASRR